MTQTTPTPLPTLGDAQRDVTSIEGQLTLKQREIEAKERQAGDDYKAVADGGDVPLQHADELARLMAQEKALRKMLEKACEVLDRCEKHAFARAVLAKADEMGAFLTQRDELAATAQAQADALAATLDELRRNGEQMMVSFHELRGRSTQTAKGVIAVDIKALSQGEHLQWLANQHLHWRLGWWRCERGVEFERGMRGATQALRGEFNDLMGLSDIDPAVLAAVRAEQQAAGGSLDVIAMANPDHDNERLIAAVPDL